MRQDPYLGDVNTAPSLHRYLYAYGNPTIYWDPDGRVGILSDGQEGTEAAVKYWEQKKQQASAEGDATSSFFYGVGQGVASVGDFVVSGLNTTSNLIYRNFDESDPERQRAERELQANVDATAQVMAGAHQAAEAVAEDPLGTGIKVAEATAEFAGKVMEGDAEAWGSVGVGVGGMVGPPGAGAANTARRAAGTVASMAKATARQAGKAAKAVADGIASIGKQAASKASQLAQQVGPRLNPLNYEMPAGTLGSNFGGLRYKGPSAKGQGGATKRGNSAQYSVAYETKLSKGMYPGRSDKAHFQDANKQLHQQMQSDPAFAKMMEGLHPGITKGVQPGARGAYPRRAPTKDTTWHHGVNPGQMQLVPRSQHSAPGAVQETLHPGGVGGMSTWGGGR